MTRLMDRIAHMDRMSVFSAAFALLGAKLLFYSSQQVNVGSVLLTACVAAAIAVVFDRQSRPKVVERERKPY
mgnify:CR=1 FL=1